MRSSVAAKYAAIADAVPKAPMYVDDEVANLILRDYAKLKQPMVEKIPVVSREINKVYLVNTIHSVESHNKREVKYPITYE